MSVASEFVQHGVVPDTIPQPPQYVAKVQYGTSHNVNLGNVLSVATAQTAPTVVALTFQPNVYYTIMMVDPDALSRPVHEFRHFLHWLVINVQAAQEGAAYDTNGHGAHSVCTYVGPTPPPGTGYHRYIQLVYQQHSKIDEKQIKSIAEKDMEERKSFEPQTWLQHTFGSNQPILLAGNFYLAGTADESMAHKTSQQMKDEAKEKVDNVKDKAGAGGDKK